MTTETFDGMPLSPEVVIARGTNPWIEVDGQVVGWPFLTLEHDVSAAIASIRGEAPMMGVYCACRAHITPVDGVIVGMDTDAGIQRCDAANIFEGDLEAARAVAVLIGGVVKFERAPCR